MSPTTDGDAAGEPQHASDLVAARSDGGTQLHENDELLELAQEAGRVGIFTWQVQSGAMWLSPKFKSLYGLADFDGRYESWRECIFREDRIRIADLIEIADGTARRLDVTDNLLRPFAASPMDHHRTALLGEQARNRLANPAAARHQRASTLELKIHAVPP
jgi:hypothetical protein